MNGGSLNVVNLESAINYISNILQKNTQFTIFLKSFHGAPLFTIDELKIWEKCFKQIGIVKIGKYPSKKDLYTDTFV